MIELTGNDLVSAKLMAGEEGEVIAALMAERVAGLMVTDHESYIDLSAVGCDLDFDMAAIGEELGFPYSVSRFLAVLATYKGDIEVGDDRVVIRVFSPDPANPRLP